MVVRIPRRFRGPSHSGNGGVSSGLVAETLQQLLKVEGPVEVTLRAPPPLDTDLTVTAVAGGVEVHHGEQLVATAQPTELALQAPPPVTVAEAADARTRYRAKDRHPLPECFVCGIARPLLSQDPADPEGSLGIHPGPVAGARTPPVFASPWTPPGAVADADGRVRPEVLWGALDCPSFYGLGLDAPFSLLGRLAVRLARRPRAGERLVVLGFARKPAEGRKQYSGAALYAGEELLGVSRAVWIEVVPSRSPTGS